MYISNGGRVLFGSSGGPFVHGYDMDRSLPEELIPSAVDGLGGSPLRVDDDDVVGRIVSVMSPPGDLLRIV
jgi:hypothetical protein